MAEGMHDGLNESADLPQFEQVDATKARRSLRNGFITLVLGGALAVGLLLAVPGLKDVARTVSHMKVPWVVVAVLLPARDRRTATETAESAESATVIA